MSKEKQMSQIEKDLSPEHASREVIANGLWARHMFNMGKITCLPSELHRKHKLLNSQSYMTAETHRVICYLQIRHYDENDTEGNVEISASAIKEEFKLSEDEWGDVVEQLKQDERLVMLPALDGNGEEMCYMDTGCKYRYKWND